MCAWLISSKCLRLLLVSLRRLKKAIGPKLTNPTSLPFAYLLPVAACNTSNFESRKLYDKEITESSLALLIVISELAVFVVIISLDEYRIKSPFEMLLLSS